MTSASFRMNAMLVATMESEQESAHRARHDSLTGLLNRASLLTEIRRSGESQGQPLQRLALFYLDLDGFKQVNDIHGHGGGDELLQHVAERMRANVPASACVARIGGDEFVIVLSDEQRDSVRLLADQLLRDISAPYRLSNGAEVTIGVSVGIAHIRPDGHTADAMLGIADRALYMAKARGKGTFHFAEAN